MQFYMGKKTDIPPHVQCLTTPGKYMPMYSHQMYPLLIEPMCTEPYYTRTVLLIVESRCTEIPRADGPPPIDPKCTEPYYTRTVLPIAEYRHTEIPRADATSPNRPSVYRTLLHQGSITYSRMQMY